MHWRGWLDAVATAVEIERLDDLCASEGCLHWHWSYRLHCHTMLRARCTWPSSMMTRRLAMDIGVLTVSHRFVARSIGCF